MGVDVGEGTGKGGSLKKVNRHDSVSNRINVSLKVESFRFERLTRYSINPATRPKKGGFASTIIKSS